VKNQSYTKKRLEFRLHIEEFFAMHDIVLFGIADLQKFSHVKKRTGEFLPGAVSFAVPMSAEIMGGIKQGPNQRYADEYRRVNQKIDSLSLKLVSRIKDMGYAANPLAASERTDPLNMKGDFPHKTAATLAGLGWIGRNCQLITNKFGPWIRLGTVFTDFPVDYNEAVNKSYCGDCQLCVDECPADALMGNLWYPGIPREELLDVWICDNWKKKRYYQFNNGHNCGICAAVCPFGK
jgi:epoxyqueuosine reductase QueG